MAIGTLAALGIGAGLGAAKHFAVDNPRYQAKKKLSAEQTRLSPWTGLAPSEVGDQPSVFEGSLGGAGYGLAMGGKLDGLGGGGGSMTPTGKGMGGWSLGGNYDLGSVSPGGELVGGAPDESSFWMSQLSKGGAPMASNSLNKWKLLQQNY